MPTLANITVKLADNTTNLVLTAIQGAGSDGTPAVWRDETGTFTSEQRLTAQISTRWNDKRTARVSQCLVRMPILRATPVANVYDITGYAECRDGRFTIPQGMTTASQQNFAAIATNFMASQLIRDCISSGFAAT